ncbi:MAG: CRISPR-associated endonuclease Cas2 [Candidatus Marinimicrobia bacterium]|nr:CRISPR-associated endonuclease Cas2 [Candidatus Neomarinimicrobiota bacterium]
MRLNPYKVMWLMVFYDLPTLTKIDRKVFARFRKDIMKDGFTKMQNSVYLRHCASRENSEIHVKRVKSVLPKKGLVSILRVTDKQFDQIETFESLKPIPPPTGFQQLEMF